MCAYVINNNGSSSNLPVILQTVINVRMLYIASYES